MPKNSDSSLLGIRLTGDDAIDLTNSSAYHERASEYIAGAVNSNVRLTDPKICFRRASGPYLEDLDGNRYIDYALGMGPTVLGHANESVVRRVRDTLEDGQLFAGQNPHELELATRLRDHIPGAELVRIGMSGSEMVHAAIRVSRAFTSRKRIVKFEGHYHGWYDNILVNLSSEPSVTTLGDSIPVFRQSSGQPLSIETDVAILPWNDMDALRAYLDQHHQDVAAIIMEGVMCNTGVILPRPNYLQSVQALCEKYDTVFILDEVITGFRLALGGAQEYYGIEPDLSIFAKALGAGFPVAALVGKARIMELFGTGGVNHSGTYNANVISLVSAIAALDELAREDGLALRRIEQIGCQLLDGIAEISARTNTNLGVQGFGSVFNVFFSDRGKIEDYRQFRNTDTAMLAEFVRALTERGVRPTSRGTFFLSSAHGEEEVESTLSVFSDALQTLGRE